MDRDSVDWKGYWPASPTPFTADGAFSAELQQELLEHYLATGVHGILINGTTGEWFSQAPAERRAVAERALAVVSGRVPVVIGCTDYTAAGVAELARHAMAAGAAGIAATPPPYAKPSDEEIVAFYEDVAAALPDVPVMVYNWPHGTSVDIGPDLAVRLAQVDTVVALKDSTPNGAQFFETNRRVNREIRVIGNFMSNAGLDRLLADGGDGTIGGGSILGAPDPEFWEAHWKGDEATCRATADHIDALYPKLWVDGGWAGHFGHYQSQLKAIMAMLGQPGGAVRPPRLPITDPDGLAALRAILLEDGLLSPERAAAPGR
jgi:dihydrodipicolinate synthase/N-acetylneuraminate lyase